VRDNLIEQRLMLRLHVRRDAQPAKYKATTSQNGNSTTDDASPDTIEHVKSTMHVQRSRHWE
jgi:hypothetical protein